MHDGKGQDVNLFLEFKSNENALLLLLLLPFAVVVVVAVDDDFNSDDDDGGNDGYNGDDNIHQTTVYIYSNGSSTRARMKRVEKYANTLL